MSASILTREVVTSVSPAGVCPARERAGGSFEESVSAPTDNRSASSASELKKLTRVALLGCGTVGSEVARRLIQSGERLGLILTTVLVRDAGKDRGLPGGLLTTQFDDVIASRPDIIIELVGGVEASYKLAKRSLETGASLVTANKALLALHGDELELLALKHGGTIAFEASVCAGVPVIAALRQLEGDRVVSIRGIVNGSCNFILSKLAGGLSFDEALAEAKAKGLVEPDPSADISGRDSAEKLCLLARASGYPDVRPEDVSVTGIESITACDVRDAKRRGFAIKLIAEFDASGCQDGEDPAHAGPTLRVGPVLVPVSSALAQASDEENALIVRAELAGELFFKGKGAGPGPTASAVLGDLVRVAGQRREQGRAAGDTPAPGGASRRGKCTDDADGDEVRHLSGEGLRTSAQTRTYCVRVSSTEPVLPEEVLGTLASSGITSREATFSRGRAWVQTHHIHEAQASSARDHLSTGRGRQTLLMPLLGT
ncbi:MAG: homoserine dehydrogenase [Pyrinomonadaceae bacterium]|nr:homoserine dehydrogenase [Phycisphaerales bacterium]